MKYSIDLQSPFAFSNYWYVIAISLIAVSFVLRFLLNRIFAVQLSSPFRLDKLHHSCAKNISAIEKAYNKDEMQSRDVHQKMSREVRKFIQDVTGLKTGTMVYEDLCRIGRPELAALIREYYEPEFALTSSVDTKSSLEKGRELVEAVYQRALKEQYIARTASRQGGLNNVLNKVMRVTVWPFRKGLLRKIKHNSLTWMERIEIAFDAGNLDPYGVHEQMSKAMRSYVYAATGAQTEDEAYEKMCASQDKYSAYKKKTSPKALNKPPYYADRSGEPANSRKYEGWYTPSPEAKRRAMAEYLREFYQPVPSNCSSEDARRMIQKGKELVKR